MRNTYKNAGFEQGTLSGWTAEGGAFTSACVYNQSEDEQGNPYYKEGEFFLYGGAAPGGERGNGSPAEPFKLKGNGQDRFSHRRGATLPSVTLPCATRTETN